MKTAKKVFAISLIVLIGVSLTYAIGCICSSIVLFLANFFFEADLFTLQKVLIGGLICNIIGILNSKPSDFEEIKDCIIEIWNE
jgi:ABC-type multidrug transport system permease subunit